MKSIQFRLLWGIGLCTSLAWAGMALMTYQLEKQQLHQAFDEELMAAARLMQELNQAGIEEQALLELMNQPSPQQDKPRPAQRWSLWLKTSRHQNAEPIPQIDPQQAAVGDIQYAEQIWRYAQRSSQQGQIIVAEPISHRDRLIHEAAMGQIIPILIFLPLCLVGCLIIMRFGLNDLQWLSNTLASHHLKKLDRIELKNPSRELVPVINSLNQLFRKLTEAMAREASFTANAAHEMRTPLAAIRTQAEVALASPQETRDHAIGQIIRASDRLQHLMNQLLSLSKIDNADFSPSQRVSVGKLLKELQADFQPLATQRNIQLELKVAEPTSLLADEASLRIALDNLLRNALRYAHSHIEIEALQAGPWMLIRISDDGPGLDRDAIAQASRRFYRAPDSRGSGSGLGLSIVERIAQLHAGQLKLQPSPALGGLQASIELPIEQKGSNSLQSLASSSSQR